LTSTSQPEEEAVKVTFGWKLVAYVPGAMTPESGRGAGATRVGEALGWTVGVELLIDGAVVVPPPPLHAVPITAASRTVPAAPSA